MEDSKQTDISRARQGLTIFPETSLLSVQQHSSSLQGVATARKKKGVGMVVENTQLKTLQLGELESPGEHIYGISSWVWN